MSQDSKSGSDNNSFSGSDDDDSDSSSDMIMGQIKEAVELTIDKNTYDARAHESGSDSDSDFEWDMDDEGKDEDSAWTTIQVNAEWIERAVLALVDTYRFMGRIHASRTCVVYAVTDKEPIDDDNNNLQALKVRLSWAQTGDPMELRILSKLAGAPHCQQLLKAYRTPSCAILVSPLYKEDLIFGLPIDDAILKTFMKQLLEALEAVHARKLIHRDVKQSNILWNSETLQLTLIDFDVSTFQTDDKHTRYIGTEGYESPEMRSEKGYDHKIDIYSAAVVLGQLLYECDEDTLSHTKVKKWKKRSRKKAHSRPVHDLFLKMIHHEPSERMEATQLLKHAYFNDDKVNEQQDPSGGVVETQHTGDHDEGDEQ